VETTEHLKKIAVNLEQMPQVKAIVVYGEAKLPADMQDKRFHLWADFIKLGKDVKDEVIFAKMQKQKPGNCCTLVYTSGTTGNPKGCMLSHDSCTWENKTCLE